MTEHQPQPVQTTAFFHADGTGEILIRFGAAEDDVDPGQGFSFTPEEARAFGLDIFVKAIRLQTLMSIPQAPGPILGARKDPGVGPSGPNRAVRRAK